MSAGDKFQLRGFGHRASLLLPTAYAASRIIFVFDGLFGADHEGGFRKMVILPMMPAKPSIRPSRPISAGEPEDRRHGTAATGSADLAGAGHDKLVLFREFVQQGWR